MHIDRIKYLEIEANKSAANCQYCLNCRNGAINELTGYGYCKNFIGGLLLLLPIEEFNTCEAWESKNK